MINLGVRAHDFGKLPVDELGRQIAAQGLSAVQLAPVKALAGFDTDAGRLSPGFARHVREALGRHGLQVAVLGCYINLADPNDTERRFQLGRFKEYLRHAREFGCSVVGTETGSLNADYSPHPENQGEAAFQAVLAGVRELVREAEKFGVFVGIEAVERYVISTPRRLRRLLDEVDSQNLQVIFDPVNLLNAANHRDQDAIIEESFALLGDRMAILHAKDFVLRDGRLESRPAGDGQLNYPLLLRHLKQRKPGINVLLEDATPASAGPSCRFLRELYAQV